MAAAQGHLWVVLLLCLISQTAEFELEESDWEELGNDVASLHRLKGFAHHFMHHPVGAQHSDDLKSKEETSGLYEALQLHFEQHEWNKGLKYNDDHLMTAIFIDLKDCQDFTACVLQKQQDLNIILENIKKKRTHDALLTASEVSYSYKSKLILIMDNEAETLRKANEAYSEDPHYSIKANITCLVSDSCPSSTSTVIQIIGSSSVDGNSLSGYSGSSLASLMLKFPLQKASFFSINGNISSTFRKNFMRVFQSHDISTVLETTVLNDHVYQLMDERDAVVEYRVQKRPVDHTTQYDHQVILIMENDYIVKEAAAYLYEKHPTVSSVYMLENERPKLIKRDPVPLSEDSRLVLVGHGKRDSDGNMRLGGYKADKVAEIIGYINRQGNHIKTTSVVACEIGSDEAFYSSLLRELDARSIKTELHLRSSLVQVTPFGQKKTAEITPEGLVWRHNDDSKKIVVKMDRNGEVVSQIQSTYIGEATYSDESKLLGPHETFRDVWPKSPVRFVSKWSRGISTDDLEALAWAFFQHRKGRASENLRQPPMSQNDQYAIYDLQLKWDNNAQDYIRTTEMGWVTSDESFINNILNQCYEITASEDILNVITHFASVGEKDPVYLMLNDWICKVYPDKLYVFPVGKRLGGDENIDRIQKLIEGQFGQHKYESIQNGIVEVYHAVEGSKPYLKDYAEYARETLQGIYKTGTFDAAKEAWFSTYFLASVISESSRNFRSFPITLMAMDIGQSNNPETAMEGFNYLLGKLPMTKGKTWINTDMRGFYGSSSPKRGRRKNLQQLIEEEDEIFKKWLETNGINLKDTNNAEPLLNRLLELVYGKDALNREDNTFKQFEESYNHFKTVMSESSSGSLGGSHDGPVTIEDMQSATDVENLLKLSAYYSRSSAVLAEHIHSELGRIFGENIQGVYVKPKSVKIENGEFHCQLVSEENPHEIKQWKLKLPKEAQIQMEKIWKNVEKVSDTTTTHFTSEHFEQAGRALGMMGLLLGAQGAVRAFERGDTVNGTIATLQTIHGITGMSLAAVGNHVSAAAENKVTKVISRVLRNPATKRALVVLPLIGIGFGIYNIEEDLKRGDMLGYIDADFDSLIVALDVVEFVEPELAPFIAPITLALNAIRMIFDDVYLDIQDELNKLPPNAGVLNKIGAFFRGLGKGIVHFILDVENFFITIPYREIENGHKFVEEISDYHKYYKTEVHDGRKTIDFTGGESSWNGGSITFCLSDQGSSEFCMNDFVSADESIGRKCWTVDTDDTADIVLGTGESNQLTYTNIQIKLLMFIPAGSIQVVSGYQALNYSRFGKYSGNNKENNFFAVQKNMDSHAMEIMLSYYYELYGKAGNDIFYIGPQRSYVEGQDGRDTYIIPEDGGNTVINNYDPLKTMDVLFLSVNFSQISVTKTGTDVILQYLANHYVRIKDWFKDDTYRHINTMSGDGILFDISTSLISPVKLLARGVNLMSKPIGQTVDTTEPLLLSITNIMGSPHNDRLIGNAQKNLIDGAGGWDYMKGGEGEDVYVVNKKQNSKVEIENYSRYKEMDMLIIEANLHDFKTKVEGNNLILIPFSDYRSDITLTNWFRSEEDRHLLVVTKDLITFGLSEDKSLCRQSDPLHSKCIQSQSIDYSKSAVPLTVDLETDEVYQNVTEVRGSNLNDNIKGNAQGNIIISGEGTDFLQGRGGQDLYIVTPGYGLKIIDNSSPDLALDTLFLKERYDFIAIKCLGTELKLFINNTEEVQLKDWFTSNTSQHLQVRTADGITFMLKSDSSKCEDQLKLPQSVDYRNGESDMKVMLMNTGEFVSVVEMYGSPGFDIMTGNDNDNLLDPYKGGGIITGGEGKDTYIVKPEYGSQVVINNFANDGKEDTVLFQAEFLTSPFTVHIENNDVIISARDKGQHMNVRLQNYTAGQKHQHLTFQSTDGVHFNVRSSTKNQSEVLDFLIEAYKVILQGKRLDCHIDVSSQRNLSTVHTVQGCSHQSNHIQGNDLDNVLFGGMKDDVIAGGDGHDTLMGGQGNDMLFGSTGNDTLYGEDGDDIMLGGSGFDIFVPGPGADMVDGGWGRDTVLYQGDNEKGEGVYINLLSGEGHHADAEGDVLKDVENVIGTIYSDILVSGYEPALLKGSDGDNVLVSVADGDYLVGGDGRDIYMMLPHHGWITIDNCAEDNATDILYLHSLTTVSVDCNKPPSGIYLKFYAVDNTFLGIFLKDWVSSTHKCGHLTLIMPEGIVSVETLQENCKFGHILKTVEITIIVGLVIIAHIVGLALFKKCGRTRKEKDVKSHQSTQQQIKSDDVEKISEGEMPNTVN